MKWIKVLAQEALPNETQKLVKPSNYTILLLHYEEQIFAVDNT